MKVEELKKKLEPIPDYAEIELDFILPPTFEGWVQLKMLDELNRVTYLIQFPPPERR